MSKIQLGGLAGALALVVIGTASAVHATAAEQTVRTYAATDPAVTAALDQILADPRLAYGTVGITVRDAASGANVYDFHADQRVIPASNMKLLTSAAALEVLGTDYRFTTTVSASSAPADGTVDGNLYLKGYGDPTIMAADYDRLAADVADAGVRVVTGKLVADDSYFDRVRLGVDWSWEDEPYNYAAQTSALSVAPTTDYDTGSIVVESKGAAEQGKPAIVTLIPENSYVKLVNNATTGAANSARSISVERDHGSGTITVSGSLPAGGSAGRNLRSVWEPTGYAAAIMRDALTRHGVAVKGDTTTGTTPGSAQKIAEHSSMPLKDMLIPFLKLSNNLHAEALTKAMGRKVGNGGTWSGGINAMTSALRGLGVDTAPIVRVDGSGMSRRDWLTTRQISNLLIGAQSKPWFSTWYEALPIAGQPDRLVGGTLASRMRNTPAAGNVHGKTGSMTGVDALSGYVTDRGGRKLIFSTVSNHNVPSVSDRLDAIAVILASSGGVGTAALKKQVPEVRNTTAYSENGNVVECSWVKAC